MSLFGVCVVCGVWWGLGTELERERMMKEIEKLAAEKAKMEAALSSIVKEHATVHQSLDSTLNTTTSTFVAEARVYSQHWNAVPARDTDDERQRD